MCWDVLGCSEMSWDDVGCSPPCSAPRFTPKLTARAQSWLCPSIHPLFPASLHSQSLFPQALQASGCDCCSHIPGKGREAGICQSTFILGTPTSITAHKTSEFYSNNNFGVVTKNMPEGFPCISLKIRGIRLYFPGRLSFTDVLCSAKQRIR